MADRLRDRAWQVRAARETGAPMPKAPTSLLAVSDDSGSSVSRSNSDADYSEESDESDESIEPEEGGGGTPRAKRPSDPDSKGGTSRTKKRSVEQTLTEFFAECRTVKPIFAEEIVATNLKHLQTMAALLNEYEVAPTRPCMATDMHQCLRHPMPLYGHTRSTRAPPEHTHEHPSSLNDNRWNRLWRVRSTARCQRKRRTSSFTCRSAAHRSYVTCSRPTHTLCSGWSRFALAPSPHPWITDTIPTHREAISTCGEALSTHREAINMCGEAVSTHREAISMRRESSLCVNLSGLCVCGSSEQRWASRAASPTLSHVPMRCQSASKAEYVVH
jgi:hypothetical protein